MSPGKNEHAFGVDLRRAAGRDEPWFPGSAERSDSPVLHKDVAAKYAPRGIHRDEGPALDQQSLLGHAEP